MKGVDFCGDVGFQAAFCGDGAAGGAGIDGRQGLDTNGKASGMNVRPTTASGHRTRACVPHTPYTLVLKFVPPAGKVCGVATHAVGGDAGYGLLSGERLPEKSKAV